MTVSAADFLDLQMWQEMPQEQQQQHTALLRTAANIASGGFDLMGGFPDSPLTTAATALPLQPPPPPPPPPYPSPASRLKACAPAWADSTWAPRRSAAVAATAGGGGGGNAMQSGTGVFLLNTFRPAPAPPAPATAVLPEVNSAPLPLSVAAALQPCGRAAAESLIEAEDAGGRGDVDSSIAFGCTTCLSLAIASASSSNCS